MSRSKKWRLEWAFFLGENGRRQYNHICKNVFTAASRVSEYVWSLVRITVPNGLKSVRIRGRKTQNNSLYSYFQREPL